ncbi:MAG: stage II sporulation protein P [Defluviitaleaceae bacterium]|nr:stage II sporulation protein P [Defluviitaleaceae bacterium]
MPKKMPKKRPRGCAFYMRTLSMGLIISIILLFAMSFFSASNPVSGGILLSETLPQYTFSADFRDNLPQPLELGAEVQAVAEVIVEGISEVAPHVATEVVVVIEGEGNEQPTLVGLEDVVIEYGTAYVNVQEVLDTRVLTTTNLDALRNPETLRNAMYIVDPRTVFVPDMFDVDRFMSQDMRVNPQSLANGDPVVLIFHTHSTEFFVDSNPADKFSGIVGVGAHLAALLNDMGIGTIHLTQRFDIVDGRSHIMGAYERQVPYIERILAENPTIEIVIDLHRDGLPEGAPKLVTEINGRPTAQIMFFNGLSTLNDNGRPLSIATLPNPNLPYNLAFSFQMQLAANDMFNNFTRRIYLNAFRYSLHFKPKSLLVEVGAQNNTFAEAINAMQPLAEILSNVIR